MTKTTYGSFTPTFSKTDITSTAFLWAARSAAYFTLKQLHDNELEHAAETAGVMLEFNLQEIDERDADYYLNEASESYPELSEALPDALKLIRSLTGQNNS